MHQVAIVGLGLIGAAAFRFLAEAGADVVGIGPEEPADRHLHDGVYASHYDQGRITRILDPDPQWADWAAASIEAYADIEQRSGIRFHHPVGCLRVSDDTADRGCSLGRVARFGREQGVAFTQLGAADLHARLPYLRFGDRAVALLEAGGAGYINPRALVAAQCALAARVRAPIIRREATRIRRRACGISIELSGGASVDARSVLLAAGAWTNRLLSEPLPLRIKPVSVVLAEVGRDTVQDLAGMPSIIYRFPDHPVLQSVYALPPIRYPDGKHYVKIGGTLRDAPRLPVDELGSWFRGEGHPQADAGADEILRRMIPGLTPIGRSTVPCAVTHTPTDHPIVEHVGGGIYVAAGGCGSAAKSSVELGRIAAGMVLNGR